MQTGTVANITRKGIMLEQSISSARILIVDDDPANIRLLTRILERSGASRIFSTTSPMDAESLFREHSPDLVLLDLHMPEMDGLEVIQSLQQLIAPGEYPPILMLTGDLSQESKAQALSGGAKDFLTKPFSPDEATLRIRNLLETRFLHLQLQQQNERLEVKVRERTAALEEAHIEILERLARAAEFRDDETGEHTRRVGKLSGLLAEELGRPPEQVELVTRAAALHDIGKIGVPDGVLLKPGKLTPREFDLMRGHTTIGATILSGSNVPLLQLSASIALTHHEHWNGKGYPEGKDGDAIPLVGRIVAVADVFDALTHERPYKQAWTIEATIDEIKAQSGRQFDPKVVEAFLRLADRGDVADLLR